ncbi:hypothetical protein [Thermobrachium celere]|uniref:DUF7852 domain-containing protein n=1 Tax=Thermobrachium celere DSM 8682 TaxID=941824 RepID=R7RPM5_9CLOT|nr:hypothetical protein [Thermobrachium celere]CDF57273.1 hypothetical protein TCEL_01187 [Thermobrachium celere DSM 8682]
MSSKSKKNEELNVKEEPNLTVDILEDTEQIESDELSRGSQDDCDSILISSKNIPECKNDPEEPCCNDVKYINVPVVISQFKICLQLENSVRFCEPVVCIKASKKTLQLKECKLIPGTKKVFIRGVIKKVLEYASARCQNSKGSSGNIRYLTYIVPFECTTEISYINPPEIKANKEQKFIPLEYHFVCEDKGYFNQNIVCEIIKYKINELMCREDIVPVENIKGQDCFYRMKEKIVLNLHLRLMQNQVVCIQKDCLG